jgi:lactose/L-arabinose transport system permease protein
VRRRQLLTTLGLHLLLTPLALLWLAPLYMMMVFATRPDFEIFSTPVPVFFGAHALENFALLQEQTTFTRALLNSIIVSSLFTVLSLVITSMAGYAFARFVFFGRGVLFTLVIATLTIPYFAVVIPQYILVARDFGISNTYWAVILPYLANAIGIFFMRQNFLGLPQAMLDAARVDGASELRTFFQIALPLVRPAMAALAIILFLTAWTDYLWPLLVLSRPEMQTAPVALGSLIGLTRVSWGGLMVGAVLMTVPFLILFLVLQRYFVAGITAGAVKD